MESQFAQIQINQTSGTLTMEQPHATVSIQQPKAEISIETTPSTLTIDQTKAWEDMNLMNILRRTEKNAQEGHQALLEGIGRRAEQGQQLMEIEHNGNPLKEQAIVNGNRPEKSLGITFIPSNFAVQIHYEPAKVSIEARAKQPIIDIKANQPIIQYERGDVSIGMKQYAQLNIDFVNLFDIDG
ncbi:DUF6470 family protein [Paracerasibacillus soli]|uniref:DUF6470 family protein n=2 Tax=Paracerasibacillus soli TaxID=480284 RepID=A0ABU5CRF8_9BACI|nr:DUF6470 family protein [Virgibacillus soli]MDY0408916.1 DUF6470 family protein [Virgibacillus soli]